MHVRHFYFFLPFSNGQSVEGADHQTVVQLIRQSGRQVKLLVISVSEDEARRLEPPSETTTNNPGVEYYERRSVPISVPETEKLTENGKEFVVSCSFHLPLVQIVYLDGKC